MLNIQNILGLAAVSLLCACAGIPPTLAPLNAQSDTAMLVVTNPGFSSSLAEFRPVDMQSHTFGEPVVAVSTAEMGSSDLINLHTARSPVWLSAVEVPPGDYALVSLATFASWGNVSFCIHTGAPVFHLVPGQIRIVSTWPWWERIESNLPPALSDDRILAEFENARAKYPEVVGPAAIESPIALISWPLTTRAFSLSGSRYCAEPTGFEISPTGLPAGIPPAPQGKGQVVFFRPSRVVGMALTFTVTENHVALGSLPDAHYFVQVADPGSHTYEIGHNETIHMEIEPGATYYAIETTLVGALAAHAVLSPSDQATFELALPRMQLSGSVAQSH